MQQAFGGMFLCCLMFHSSVCIIIYTLKSRKDTDRIEILIIRLTSYIVLCVLQDDLKRMKRLGTFSLNIHSFSETNIVMYPLLGLIERKCSKRKSILCEFLR